MAFARIVFDEDHRSSHKILSDLSKIDTRSAECANVSSNDFRAALNELIYQTGIEEDRAILMYLSNKVVNYSHRKQHPQYGKINNPDLDEGDFIFV